MRASSPSPEREPLIVKVFYHDKCFDGACSASLFTRFYRERIRRHAEFQYQGLLHRAGALFDLGDFTGDENAIVDFKYLASEKLTWWFDHHQSAFLTEEDAEHFEREESNTKFFDPGFRPAPSFWRPLRRAASASTWRRSPSWWSGPTSWTARPMRAPRSPWRCASRPCASPWPSRPTRTPTFIPRLIELLAYQPLAEIVADAVCRQPDSAAAGAAPALHRDHPQAQRVHRAARSSST